MGVATSRCAGAGLVPSGFLADPCNPILPVALLSENRLRIRFRAVLASVPLFALRADRQQARLGKDVLRGCQLRLHRIPRRGFGIATVAPMQSSRSINRFFDCFGFLCHPCCNPRNAAASAYKPRFTVGVVAGFSSVPALLIPPAPC